jgi:hypothetical protein
MTHMTFREMNLNVFAGQPVPHVLFQPRLEPWFDWHKNFGLDAMPARYRGQSLTEFFDQHHISMRYVHYYTGMPDPIVSDYAPQVEIHHTSAENMHTWACETPFGELEGVSTAGRSEKAALAVSASDLYLLAGKFHARA